MVGAMDAAAPDFRTRLPVVAQGGMVCTSQPLAAAAGARILEAGGNATDAAVATAAALAVTEPCNTGPGGDCFALVYDAAADAVSALNGSGRAPAALDLELLAREGLDGGLPEHHPHTVTVPGAVAGWADALERRGSLPMATVLEPAVRLAEAGFAVTPVIAVQWAAGVPTQLAHWPGGEELAVEGRGPRPGEIFRNPGLARTLRLVAEGGAEAFYTGPPGRAIAAAVRDAGGVLSEADLAEHRSTWEEPIHTTYRGLRVWECPPNGQGLAALLALGLLRGVDLAGQDPLGPERLHLLVEAMRLAFADARRYVADPASAEVPVVELLSEGYLRERRALLDPRRAHPDASFGRPRPGAGTVYLCAVDRDGNACSFINSNYKGFGSGIVPRGFGFSLQNRGLGFDLDPAHPNALAPRKRPYHTIIPGLLTREEGGLWGPFGVMGGFMQPQGHLQVVCALADDGLDPQAALDRPRFCIPTGTADGDVLLEEGIPEATLAELAARGHRVQRVGGYGRILFGKGQAIRRDAGGALWGGSDLRADGVPVPCL